MQPHLRTCIYLNIFCCSLIRYLNNKKKIEIYIYRIVKNQKYFISFAHPHFDATFFGSLFFFFTKTAVIRLKNGKRTRKKNTIVIKNNNANHHIPYSVFFFWSPIAKFQTYYWSVISLFSGYFLFVWIQWTITTVHL